jgi:hypothetical protein
MSSSNSLATVTIMGEREDIDNGPTINAYRDVQVLTTKPIFRGDSSQPDAIEVIFCIAHFAQQHVGMIVILFADTAPISLMLWIVIGVLVAFIKGKSMSRMLLLLPSLLFKFRKLEEQGLSIGCLEEHAFSS